MYNGWSYWYFAARSGGLTSPGSEVRNQRGAGVANMPFPLVTRAGQFGTVTMSPLQKIKIDLARVRAQSVTSYRVATSRAVT
jgi:hypothetical protein